MKLAVMMAVLGSGCSGPCWDDNTENNESCGNDSRHVLHGEGFDLRAVTSAGDHVVALVKHADHDLPRPYEELLLVDVDATGEIVSSTVADAVEIFNPSVGADGQGAAVIVDTHGAQFFRDGVLFDETELTGATAVQFGAGAFWIATGSVGSSDRQLLRFDPTGVQLDKIEMPDGRTSSMPSIALDPLGTDLAAGWLLAEPGVETLVLVHRIRDNATRAFEFGSMNGRGWISTVAVRAGTIAILFGDDRVPPTLAMISPEGEVTTTLQLQLPSRCREETSVVRQLIATVDGYLLTCRERFVMFGPDGSVLATPRAPEDTLLATTTDGALAITPAPSGSIDVQRVTSDVGEPVVLFEGSLTSEEVGGCLSATRSSESWWLIALALLGLRRRQSSARSLSSSATVS